MGIDFAYPARRVAIELDGHLWHSGQSDLQRDGARRTCWRICPGGRSPSARPPCTTAGAVVAAVAGLLRAEGA